MSFLPAIQGYGDLQLVEVFVAYDGPRVLSAQSATGQFFLAGWAAEGPEYDDWMFVPISSARLVMVRWENNAERRLHPPRVNGLPRTAWPLA